VTEVQGAPFGLVVSLWLTGGYWSSSFRFANGAAWPYSHCQAASNASMSSCRSCTDQAGHARLSVSGMSYALVV
jgi:hypothetical protein